MLARLRRVVDPVLEFQSSYVFGPNNPIMGIDPNGMFWEELGNLLSGYGWWTNEMVDFYKQNPSWKWNSGMRQFYLDYSENGNPAMGVSQKFEASNDFWFFLSDIGESSSSVTPFEVGVEWLTGEGPRHRTFKGGDYFTGLLKKHTHIIETLNSIPIHIRNGQNKGSRGYDLTGLKGIPKYAN
jgi:hypothetical protein